ncbi:MAG: 30S ribosomal protein S17 [Candidatus Altiarchaeales archaeon ex4484_96]|nr:MAG: 30S ribosomal protein S17 [Candidatus Altiarchaeales archaeon ex4484_96]
MSTKKNKVECNDKNCPIHGQLPTRGIVLEGVVVSDKMNGTVVVQKNYFIKSGKYERYRAAKSRIPAHNPPCIGAKTGDNVRIEECRKLSKTVNFVVTKKL